MTGYDLLLLRLRGRADEYLALLNADQLIEVAQKSIQINQDIELLVSAEEVDAYLKTVIFPDIDPTYLWMLARGSNFQ